MRLSKDIVSHIFSAWCAESGEPVLWNWIKNDGKEPTIERLNADLLVSDIEYPNLDDFIQSAIEWPAFPAAGAGENPPCLCPDQAWARRHRSRPDGREKDASRVLHAFWKNPD